MVDTDDAYSGVEQAITKHALLQRYLDRVAHKWLYNAREIAFIDGFAGPYGAGAQDFSCSSPAIAVETLLSAKSHIEEHRSKRRVRCLFVESDEDKYRELQRQFQDVIDVEVKVIPGKFAECVDVIADWLGSSFGLIFIDPEGFTEYPFSRVGPLLRAQRGEVIVNFMYNFVNRAIDHPDPKIQEHMVNLFGEAWRTRLDSYQELEGEREHAITRLFREHLKDVGSYTFAASTPVLMPDRDRTLYHLVYGTRKLEGLIVFREVEREAQIGQSSVRRRVTLNREEARDHIRTLFDADEMISKDDYKRFFERDMCRARIAFDQMMDNKSDVAFDAIVGALLQKFMIRVKDAGDIVAERKKAGKVRIDGLTDRERKPKCFKGHRVISIS